MACVSKLVVAACRIDIPHPLTDRIARGSQMKEDSLDASQKQKRLNVLCLITPWLSVFARYLFPTPNLTPLRAPKPPCTIDNST
jgi:hypothetical protein